MSYAGILGFIKGDKHEKIDAENITINNDGQAVEGVKVDKFDAMRKAIMEGFELRHDTFTRGEKVIYRRGVFYKLIQKKPCQIVHFIDEDVPIEGWTYC